MYEKNYLSNILIYIYQSRESSAELLKNKISERLLSGQTSNHHLRCVVLFDDSSKKEDAAKKLLLNNPSKEDLLIIIKNSMTQKEEAIEKFSSNFKDIEELVKLKEILNPIE